MDENIPSIDRSSKILHDDRIPINHNKSYSPPMQPPSDCKPATWMVLATHQHRESVAMCNLRRQSYAVYCPMILAQIRHARRSCEALRPLFPGYIFVTLQNAAQSWRPIAGTFGVRSILRNGETPAFLPPGLVESLQAREMDGAVREPKTPFAPGQTVAITGGPFDGLIGKVLNLRDSDRILVLLDLLNQQTKVQVDAKMLRSA
jgi:transcriptional antiterminator RfaH